MCHSRDLRCLRLCTTSGAALRKAFKSSGESFDRGDDDNRSKSESEYIGREGFLSSGTGDNERDECVGDDAQDELDEEKLREPVDGPRRCTGM